MLQYYVDRLPIIRQVARKLGYAIGLHGSGERDLDLIAVPWEECAAPAEDLVIAITRAICGFVAPRTDGGQWPRIKPHGRVAWAIQIGNGRYLDLSITPLSSRKIYNEEDTDGNNNRNLQP